MNKQWTKKLFSKKYSLVLLWSYRLTMLTKKIHAHEQNQMNKARSSGLIKKRLETRESDLL